MNGFQLPIAISVGFAVTVLVISITKTCKSKFTLSRTRNKLTMKTFYLLNLFLIGNIIEKSCNLS